MNDVKIKYRKSKKVVMLMFSSDERYKTYTADYEIATGDLEMADYNMVSEVVDKYQDLEILNISLDEDIRKTVELLISLGTMDGYFLENLKEMV